MYQIIVRNIRSGEVHRIEEAYTPSLKKGAKVFGALPGEEKKTWMKIIAWKWTGDEPVNSRREIAENIADSFLLFLDFPQEFKDEILKLRLKSKMLKPSYNNRNYGKKKR